MRKNKKAVVSLGMALTLAAAALNGCTGSGSAPTTAAVTEKQTEAATAAGAETAATEKAASKSDYPNKDVTVIVPWNPGGGTDLTVRALVEEMGNDLGKRMTVTNMPGASGSVGMQDVFDSAKDGYKVLGHGMMAFTNSQVMGLVKSSYKEWIVWDAAFSPNVIAVRKDSPYKSIDDLIAAMKEKPGDITASSAGVGTGGHIGASVFAQGVGVEFEHIPYEGGNPAIIAALSGEVDFTAQLSMEMIDMLRSGDLVGLACLSDNDLVIEGASGTITIPSIKSVAPEMAGILPVGESFGILVPAGTPDDVVAALDSAYKKAVQSDSFKKLADEKGMVVFGYGIDETSAYLDKLAATVCWTLYDIGSAKISPDTVGIPRP